MPQMNTSVYGDLFLTPGTDKYIGGLSASEAASFVNSIKPDSYQPTTAKSNDGILKRISDALKGVASQQSYSSIGSAEAASRSHVDIPNAEITSAVSGIPDAENRANAYSEMMANTAHQREVADLLAAGLNPALSAKYNGAQAASAASGGGSSGSSGGSSGSVKKTGFQLPVINNPRTPMQILYNVVAQNSDLVVSGAKALASAFAQN